MLINGGRIYLVEQFGKFHSGKILFATQKYHHIVTGKDKGIQYCFPCRDNYLQISPLPSPALEVIFTFFDFDRSFETIQISCNFSICRRFGGTG